MLDRLLQRQVSTSVEVPASMVYSFDTLHTAGGDGLDPGTWILEPDSALLIAPTDSGGLGFPQDLELPLDDVGVAWDGADATLLTLTALEVIRHGFTFQPISLRLTFDGPLPAAGTALTIAVQTGGTMTVTQTVTRPVWAARRDFRARDQLSIGDGQFFTLEDTRFVVRAEGPPWSAGDTFVDDGGQARTVRGVNEIGRSRYLEILARSVG